MQHSQQNKRGRGINNTKQAHNHRAGRKVQRNTDGGNGHYDGDLRRQCCDNHCAAERPVFDFIYAAHNGKTDYNNRAPDDHHSKADHNHNDKAIINKNLLRKCFVLRNPASLSDLRNSGAKIIVINMWEPWCPPCVNELPELQRLYANYKDDGLVVVGAFDDNYSEAVSLVESNGITYPVIQGTQSFSDYYTGYVPTTIIIDSYGNVLTSEPIVGAMSYSQWEATVRPYLY